MYIFRKARQLQNWLHQQRQRGKTLGFVPTMGALHPGHISLIRRCQQENDCCCCSIFVNPTQFNDAADLHAYPRTPERDVELLTSAACDVLFWPEVEEMYPEGTTHLTSFDLAPLDTMLEGLSRPGHFQGVANVVDRLLRIIEPERIYLGQKDYQQVKVIERLIALQNYTTQVVMCATVREADGLAYSSRNVRLSPEQRVHAAEIWIALQQVSREGRSKSMADLQRQAIHRLQGLPETRVDYLAFCDAETFAPLQQWPEDRPVVCVVAVWMGGVRLLDNVVIS